MLYLLGGFAVLSGFLLLVYLFVNADPARLARGLKVTGIVIAVAAVATLAISGRATRVCGAAFFSLPLVTFVTRRFMPSHTESQEHDLRNSSARSCFTKSSIARASSSSIGIGRWPMPGRVSHIIRSSLPPSPSLP